MSHSLGVLIRSLSGAAFLGVLGCSGGSSVDGPGSDETSGGNAGAGGSGGASGTGAASGTAGSDSDAGQSGGGASGSAGKGQGGSGGGNGGAGSGGTVSGGSGGEAGNAGTNDGSCKKNTALPAGRCREGADCQLGAFCSQSPLTGGCGANFMAMRLCELDSDCASGSVCLEGPVPACTTGTPTACGSPCSEDSCPSGQRCGADGHCEPTPCDDGFECAAGKVCEPLAAQVDQNGCRFASCESDAFVCAEDRVCDATASGKDVNGCAAKPCSDGSWTCAAGEVCGEPTGYDPHGCRCGSNAFCGVDQVCTDAGYCSAKTCASDDDCECGVCVNKPSGICNREFYFCAMAAA